MSEIDLGVVRRLADLRAVYRMFDHAGRLLYIGRTGSAGQRFGQHSEKVWFPQVSLITLEWHDTHAQAVLAETRAIAAERPRYNVVGTPKLASRRKAQPAKERQEQARDRDVLGDVLKIFGDTKGMQWATIAERLAAQFPERWSGATKLAVAAECRALGVPSINVRHPASLGGGVQRGCCRADIEVAAANRILGKAVQPWKR